MQNKLEGLIIGLNIAKERISELKDTSIEISQIKKQSEKNSERNITGYSWIVGQFKNVEQMCNENTKKRRRKGTEKNT